ncbi:2-methylcitrate dehydratase PrpD [Annulohypoxylon maeteangense]|uniref:2-methylcitrate dehydratase PrpD n=1 Tax=Annulohypoxylon maeteangense TaxID=1927788 RepID=UPI002008E138|nr:2-methylcitrate dehydratase PrpD [Annulohypoxylon maeteangense]KAI0884146.1 2-methylcitrate dehydratase PrpD [Annulohypoxylon maeteangense]
MATLALASWATNLTYTNLPTPVLDAAVKSIYNWAGCAIGGFGQDAPQIALNTSLAVGFNGPATSSILGLNSSSDAFADAQLAAFINGIASHVDDYDDTHLATVIHPSGVIASALFAITEARSQTSRDGGPNPVSGPDFLTAFIAGVETSLHLGRSVFPEHYDVGWHITSTTGSIGAAVAVSKLLGLDTEHTQQAIGIASTQVVGMQAFFGSMTKAFHIGRATQSGLLAALLAREGYTSSLTALEDQYGWLHVVTTRENATAEFEQLGTVWEIEENTFKPFPCGIVMHPAIDGAIQIYDEMVALGKTVQGGEVERIDLRMNPEVLVLTGQTDPQTGLAGKFSIYHAAAVGLLYGQATPAQFTDAVVLNSTVVALRKLVNVTTDADVAEDAAHVNVTFSDGSTVNKYVEHAIGSLANPLTVAELKTKFMDQVTKQIGGARAEKAYTAFTNIGNMTDVGTLRTLF